MSVDPSQDPDPIEQLLLTAYPNPERKGCPGRSVLETLASKKRDAEDPNWYHVWHCSPCYAEFKELRDGRWEHERLRAHGRRRVTLAAAAALIVIGASGTFWFVHEHSGSASIQLAQVTIDLSDVDAVRGVGRDHAINLHPLPRKVDDVRIILPRFSEAGRYTVAVLRSRDSGSALAVSDAATVGQGQKLELSVRLDLSHAPAGSYLLGTRLNNGGLVYYYPLKVE